jgi:hypothetical protein
VTTELGGELALRIVRGPGTDDVEIPISRRSP